MEIIKIIDAEIAATTKSVKHVNVHLTRVIENKYKAFLPFKIEGDFILNSKQLQDIAVTVEWQSDHLTLEIDSEDAPDHINAFLAKDEAAILRAVKKNVKLNELTVSPSFIIGPPGTGKTSVITNILDGAMKLGLRVLVLSPTNMAVENVFERINVEAYSEGEVVLSITTQQEELQELSPKEIKKRKLQPIEDELGILEKARKDIYMQRRDAQPTLEKLESAKESANIMARNFKADFSQKNHELKKVNAELTAVTRRIEALTSNSFLKGIARTFMGSKVEELEDEKQKIEKIKAKLLSDIAILENKISTTDVSSDKAQRELSEARKIILESNTLLEQIAKQSKQLKEQAEALKNNDIFKSAKVVGATLAGGAINKKIQEGGFDIIIVDEASMAPIPLLVVASQSIKAREKALELEYENVKSLTVAQNTAVKMALGSQLIIVGDPRQLSPIAKTYEMRQSIFDFYGIDAIFEGETVANTVFLDINYRNHPDIVDVASRLFYGGLLKTGKEHDGMASLYLRRSKSKMVHSDGSFINHGNMTIAVTQVKSALEKGRRRIGVITPFKKQAALINTQLVSLMNEYPDADIQVGTIHTFQGKERDIIIYDITYSPDESDNEIVPPTYRGDITSETAKLLNVAMTRAEGFFVVIGNIDGILNMKQNSLVLREWLKEICMLAK